MLTDSRESTIVSSMGWTDRNCLWILDIASERIGTAEISKAKYMSLHPGRDDFFSILHHYESDRLEITAHGFESPSEILSRIVMNGESQTFEGDGAAWQKLPRAYTAFFKHLANSASFLFLIDPAKLRVEIRSLSWYDDSYDKDYQGIVGVTEVPDQCAVIFSVQRDSHPILFRLEGMHALQKIPLAGRQGNPALHFRRTANELWASDYDTLVRINPSDWKPSDSLLIQPGPKGHMDFIGEFAFNQDETLCAVARPFSSDVVVLNTQTFRVTHHCKVGSQPLQTALLSDGRVYARDWKTGRLLKGKIRRKWFW